MIYLYPGGPLLTQTSYDEGNAGAVRQVNYTYGSEGELKAGLGQHRTGFLTLMIPLYRLSSLTDGNGHTTYYSYNAAGYLQQIVYPGAPGASPGTLLPAGTADTLSFLSYDADGNLTQREDGQRCQHILTDTTRRTASSVR